MTAGDIRAIQAAWDQAWKALAEEPQYPRTTTLDPHVDCDCRLEWESPGKAEVLIRLACPHHGRGTVYLATFLASRGTP